MPRTSKTKSEAARTFREQALAEDILWEAYTAGLDVWDVFDVTIERVRHEVESLDEGDALTRREEYAMEVEAHPKHWNTSRASTKAAVDAWYRLFRDGKKDAWYQRQFPAQPKRKK